MAWWAAVSWCRITSDHARYLPQSEALSPFLAALRHGPQHNTSVSMVYVPPIDVTDLSRSIVVAWPIQECLFVGLGRAVLIGAAQCVLPYTNRAPEEYLRSKKKDQALEFQSQSQVLQGDGTTSCHASASFWQRLSLARIAHSQHWSCFNQLQSAAGIPDGPSSSHPLHHPSKSSYNRWTVANMTDECQYISKPQKTV